MVVCRMTLMKLRQALGGQVLLPDDWETTAEVIRETGRKVLGVSSGRRKEDKETWWWNEEVQDSIQRKRLAKKKWDMDRTEENRQEYKELQCRVKREVSKAKQKAYDELYTRLDIREGEKDLYRLARQRDRDGKDVQQVRVIKDRDGRVLTSEESVQRRWKEYFEELMNEENEREKRVEGVNSVEQKVDKIRKNEVRKALKRMKSGKAVGPDNIPVEVWKCLGEAAVEFLASLFNRVLENLEKAYDRVPREELWYCMRKSGVAEKYVRVVQDMYERSRTVVRCAVVMDQLSEEVRQESPWTMMFADDIVICSESREQVEENLERWRFALERRGMKVSRSKTEYMCVNEREGSGTVSLQGEEVKKVQEFKYLGSTVQSNGECGKEISVDNIVVMSHLHCCTFISMAALMSSIIGINRVLPSFQCFASGMSGPGLPAVSDAGQMESAMFFPSLRGRFGYNMSTRIKGSLANSSEKRTVITEVKPQNRCVLLLSISHAITQMDGYSPQRRLDLRFLPRHNARPLHGYKYSYRGPSITLAVISLKICCGSILQRIADCSRGKSNDI
ncbi:hypothetical protein QTP86_012957 [Hemibagrus guttatus]|nr:hypothetical protein QTP86_012957 [Hemibagrus guttatus]